MVTNATMTDAWTLQLTNSALRGRLHDGLFLAPATGGPMVWRDGVVPSTMSSGVVLDLSVTTDSPTASMSTRVYPGQCVINRSGQGPYGCSLNAFARVTHNASDTTNPRIDCVVARLYDSAIGDSQTGPWIEVITGTPAATPSAPAVPTGAIKLAEVTVPATATQIVAGNIADKRRSTAPRGAPRLLLAGDSASDAGAYAGELRQRTYPEWWDGSAWRGLMSICYDTTTVDTTTYTVTAPLMTVSIADPGWQYRVEAQGTIEYNLGPGVSTEATLTLDGSTTRIGPRQISSISTYTNSSGSLLTGIVSTALPARSGVLTGAHSVSLTLTKTAGPGGNGFVGVTDSNFSAFTVKVIPV